MVLSPRVAQSLFLLIDPPHVDLFASLANNQLPIYCARGPDPEALQIDALAMHWDGPPVNAYAISLIPQVLTETEQDHCKVLSIAPIWPP